MQGRLLVLVIAALLQAACSSVPTRPPVDPATVPDAVPKVEPFSKSGNPESYVQFGKRYWVLPSPYGFVQRGKASWYGKKFHGRRTSSGEEYDMYAMSAAHKTLPIPTYARVTNLDNGRSVVVRINDRGPFVDDRIVDLSFSAASRLGMIGPGTANVELKVLDPHQHPEVQVAKAPQRKSAQAIPRVERAAKTQAKPKTKMVASPPAAVASEKGVTVVQMPIVGQASPSVQPVASNATVQRTSMVVSKASTQDSQKAVTAKAKAAPDIFLQLGAYAVEKNAEATRAKLTLIQPHAVAVEKVVDALGALYQVKVGPLASVAEARRLASRLKSHGYDQSRILQR